MNAEEARKQSMENAESEIIKISKIIADAVKIGDMNIEWKFKDGEGYLKEGTKKWLRDNNYKIKRYTYTEDDSGYYIISW